MSTPDRRGSTLPGGSLRAPAAGLLVSLAAAAALAGPWGAPLGSRAVKAEIAPDGDVDSYLIEAHAGGLLDVRLAPAKGSALVPDVALVGPDGTVLDAAFEPAGPGLRLRRFAVPSSGRHELRIAGRDGTSGEYSVSAKVKGSAAVKLKGLRLAAGEERGFDFAAGPDASLSFSVRAKPSAAHLVRIESPSGVAVAVPAGSVRSDAAGRLSGRRIPLPAGGGFGTWRVVVRADGGLLDGVRVKISTRGGRLPAIRGRVPTSEPVLSAVAPGEAGDGTLLTVSALGLTTTKKHPLRLFVAGIEAHDVVLLSATSARATMPAGLAGPVDVGLLNGDGHAAVLRGALVAVPPPRATSFDPVRGPAGGGTTVLVAGSGFRPGTAVTVAGTAFPANTDYVDGTLLRFTTPAFASGPQTIGVRDATGQEAAAPATFDFVAPPFVLAVRPPLVPLLPGETTTLFGGSFTDAQTVAIGGLAPASITLEDSSRMHVGVPALPAGTHDVLVSDALGQTSLVTDGLAVFTFAAGPALDGSGGPPPADMALCDYDDDGDLDVFLVSAGGGTLSTESLLRVLRNDGADGYTDVTDAALPAPGADDWRGDTISFGDVAGDVGVLPPDGHPDIVIGSLDESVLPALRSRVRVLANRAGPGGTRVFVDRTSELMAPTSQYDDWRAEDLWIGDLDGDGGVPDIVATFDEVPEGVSPLSPYYVYYLSGTRVFSFATPQSGGPGAFAWQSRRMPQVIGTQVATPGLPQCVGGACRETYTPFRGRSLAVTDLDGDGRRDIAVTSPGALTVSGVSYPSTQVARNVNVLGLDVMQDRTPTLNDQAARLLGDIVLAGDVIGDEREDLVIVRNPSTGSGVAVDVMENRGPGVPWRLRTSALLPAADADERLQADSAQLADVDGDGDLDLVLLVVSPPTAAATSTGFGLRMLRNHGEAGFSRELEDLLPSGPDERWNGSVLGVGPFDGQHLGIVLARQNAAGDGTDVRTILRTLDE